MVGNIFINDVDEWWVVQGMLSNVQVTHGIVNTLED